MAARSQTLVAVVAALVGAAGLTACDPPPPADLVVDVAFDAPDADPGDGVCAAAGGGCTLRAALALTDTGEPSGQRIVEIADGVDPVLTLGSITRSSGLVLRGGGATIDAGGAAHLLRMGWGNHVIEDLTITGVGAGGAAITSFGSGSTRVRHVTIVDNDGWGIRSTETSVFEISDSLVSRNAAGGVWTYREGSLLNSTVSDNGGPGVVTGFVGGADLTTTVVLSTISGNTGQAFSASSSDTVMVATSVVGNGGGVYLGWDATVVASALADNAGNVEAEHSLTLRQSTVSGNLYPLHLGGDNAGSTIEGSTIADNGGGDFQITGEGPLHLAGSIVSAAEVGGATCATEWGPTVTSGGWNVATDEACGLTATGDQQGVDPILGPLIDLFGPTPVRTPGQGSPAVEAVPIGTPGLCDGVKDQRFITRPQGSACEAGSLEYPDV